MVKVQKKSVLLIAFGQVAALSLSKFLPSIPQNAMQSVRIILETQSKKQHWIWGAGEQSRKKEWKCKLCAFMDDLYTKRLFLNHESCHTIQISTKIFSQWIHFMIVYGLLHLEYYNVIGALSYFLMCYFCLFFSCFCGDKLIHQKTKVCNCRKKCKGDRSQLCGSKSKSKDRDEYFSLFKTGTHGLWYHIY